MPVPVLVEPQAADDLTVEALLRLRARAQGTNARPRWVPQFYQRPPDPADPWRYWGLVGGRGIGKTDAGAEAINAHALGPPCAPHFPGGHRMSIIAPTLGDALESCVNGISGVKMHNPDVRLVQGIGGAHVRWPNGAEARLFGAYTPEDVERFRAGGNRCFVWAEELAAWPKLNDVWTQMEMGLRIGPAPRVVFTTTPKPVKVLKELLADPLTVLGKTEDGRTPTTDDNPHLPAEVRAKLYAKYQGTRIGRQELGGEMLGEVEGALWTLEQINALRVATAPALERIVVAIDPTGTSTDSSDEVGIIVAGKGTDGHGYVLADYSGRYSPDAWARRAIKAYRDHNADLIVAETNYGGDMVEHTLRTVEPTIPYTKLTASRGKHVRAEPIAALDEQGRVHHVGPFPELEDQLCAMTANGYEGDGSPDRLDARVWALTELFEDGRTEFF